MILNSYKTCKMMEEAAADAQLPFILNVLSWTMHTTKGNEVTDMTNSNEDNIRRVQEELSSEIPFEYDMTTDTMYFSDKYKQVYDRKPKIHHFVKSACKDYLAYDKNISRLEEFRRILDYGDMNRYIQLQWPDRNGKYEWCEIVFRHVLDNLGNV